MKCFSFDVEICLGYHCCGCGEYITCEGTALFEDEDVDRLVSLIRENGGETDIEKLGLKEKYPSIYEDLEDAYEDAVSIATYRYWLINGFECGYYDEPDDLMSSLEEAGLFQYGPEPADLEGLDEDEVEEAKEDAFHEWLETYVGSLNEDEKVSFLETYYGDMVSDGDSGDYTIEIPKEIIDLAGY